MFWTGLIIGWLTAFPLAVFILALATMAGAVSDRRPRPPVASADEVATTTPKRLTPEELKRLDDEIAAWKNGWRPWGKGW